MGHDRKRQTPVEGMHAYLGMYGQKFKGQRSKVKGTWHHGESNPLRGLSQAKRTVKVTSHKDNEIQPQAEAICCRMVIHQHGKDI